MLLPLVLVAVSQVHYLCTQLFKQVIDSFQFLGGIHIISLSSPYICTLFNTYVDEHKNHVYFLQASRSAEYCFYHIFQILKQLNLQEGVSYACKYLISLWFLKSGLLPSNSSMQVTLDLFHSPGFHFIFFFISFSVDKIKLFTMLNLS